MEPKVIIRRGSPRVVVRKSSESDNHYMASIQHFGFNEYYNVCIAYGGTEEEALKNLINCLNIEIHEKEMDLALVKDKLYFDV